MRGKVASVGELDALRAAVGARLNDLLAYFDVGMIEDRDDTLLHHGEQYGDAIFRGHW